MWQKIQKALSGLVMEHGSGGRLSVGRMAFWPVLIVALWEWGVKDNEIQLFHFLTLLTLMVYNTGTKMIAALRAVKEFAAGLGLGAPKMGVKHLEKVAEKGEADRAAAEAAEAAEDDEEVDPDEIEG